MMRKKALSMFFALMLACTSLDAQAMLTEEEQLYYKEKRAETEQETQEDAGAQEPGIEAEAPETGTEEPGTEAEEPETESEETETESEERETESEEPETESEEPEKPGAEDGASSGEDEAPLVVLDPGHQAPDYCEDVEEPNGPGSDTMRAGMTLGAQGTVTHLAEYELNLDICLQLKEELIKRGYRVILTRETHEVSLTDSERCEIANEAGADIFIHIHGNDSEDAAVTGAMATSPSYANPYVSERYNSSMKLTDDVLDTYCEVTGLNNRGIYENDNLTSINFSKVPVTVMELGYMSNPQDDEYMADADNQKIMVKGLADGIDKYFGRQGE